MKKQKTKLSELQLKYSGIEFIKSYPILNNLDISPLEINILELILSFQDNGKDFYMKKSDIAKILGSTEGSIKYRITNLSKKGYLVSIQKHHEGRRGSHSMITVSLDKIIKEIDSFYKVVGVKDRIDLSGNTSTIIGDIQPEVKVSKLEVEVPTIESKEVIQDEIIEEVVEKPKFIKKTTTELTNYVMENSEGIDVQTIEDFKTAIFCGDIRDFWEIDGVIENYKKSVVEEVIQEQPEIMTMGGQIFEVPTKAKSSFLEELNALDDDNSDNDSYATNFLDGEEVGEVTTTDEVSLDKSNGEYAEMYTLGNGVVVGVCAEDIEIWNQIKGRKGTMRNMRNNTSQFTFDMQLKEEIVNIKNNEVIINNYISK